MSTTFACEQCGTSLTVADESPGELIPCRRCGAMQPIPVSPASSRPGDLRLDPARPPVSSGKSRRLNPKAAIVALAVLAALGLAGGVLLAMAGRSSRRELEATLKERIELNRGLATLLDRVGDVLAARAASPGANSKIRAIASNLRKLQLAKGSKADLEALRMRYRAEELDAEQEVIRQLFRVATIDGAWEALAIRPALVELELEEKSISGAPRAVTPTIPAEAEADPLAPPPVSRNVHRGGSNKPKVRRQLSSGGHN